MIKLITEAFKEGLVEADWMDNETRVEAERKAEKITNMIGRVKGPMKNPAGG